MANAKGPGLARGLIRWAARVLSIVSTTLLLLFLFGGAEKFEVSKLSATELLGLAFFPFGVMIGFAVAWWKEGLGGAITVGSLLAFYLIFGLVGKGNLGWWFLVFAFPGLLFLASHLLARTRPS